MPITNYSKTLNPIQKPNFSSKVLKCSSSFKVKFFIKFHCSSCIQGSTLTRYVGVDSWINFIHEAQLISLKIQWFNTPNNDFMIYMLFQEYQECFHNKLCKLWIKSEISPILSQNMLRVNYTNLWILWSYDNEIFLWYVMSNPEKFRFQKYPFYYTQNFLS